MIGATLLNRYRLETELGRGGMGSVYRGHDTLLDRDVAIKLLTDPGLGAPGRARLLREARAAARLNHPNIIAIYDVAETASGNRQPGEEPASPGHVAASMPFIIMELARGETLDRRALASVAEVLDVARQVCAALQHAHDHGIIHRDLKPENVVVAADGTAKLMDFGLARHLAGDDGEPLPLGTVLYLAPEQARGQPVDARADLYALGVLLYEALTGRLPFIGDDPLAVIAQHLSQPPTPPRHLRPELPPALEAIILRLLAKNPNDRYDSARAVADALAAVPADGRAQPARPNNLPADLTSFIGREREITEVGRLLAGTRLLTLTGSGGTGKTRLALRAAGQAMGDFHDGVWLVDMAPLADAALVPQSVAAVVGVRDEPGAPLTRRIADVLHYRHLLLIFDNCEHLIEAVAALAEALLRGCPDVKLLVTSREPLGIAGETIYRVPSLSLPPEGVSLGAPEALAAQSEAVSLFVERAGSARPGFALGESNADAVVQICRQLDGLPLALELAAARVRALEVEQIAARLDDRFRLLTGGSRTALPRQQTLRALIDWSWDLLTAAEKVLLRRLSVFAGGWTLEAAEFVTPDAERVMSDSSDVPSDSSPIRRDDVLELLTRLVDKSLVVVEEPGGAARYRLLETIRQYAREHALEAGEAEAKGVRQRHLDYHLNLAEAAEPALRAAEQLEWLARLEAEHDNLRAALKWAGAARSPVRSAEEGLRLAGALARFWYLHGYWSEGRRWLQQAVAKPLLEPAPDSLRRARAKALAGLAWLMDENDQAIPLYEESLALYRQLGDHADTAFALRGLGATLVNQGEPERARQHLDQALEIYRALPDPWGIGAAQFNLGWICANRDDAEGAAAAWAESLSMFQQSGDRWGMAVALGALSYLERLRGAYARAVDLTEESLAHFRAVGDKAGIATSLSRLGTVAFRRADYQQAIALTEEGMALQRELGEQGGLATAYALLGQIETYHGDYERAVAWLEQSLALARDLGDSIMAAYHTGYLALTYYYAADLERAAALWQESLVQLRADNERFGMGLALNGLGLVAWRRGDLNTAQAQLEESLGAFRAALDKRYVALALNDLGRLAHARRDDTAAQALGRQALSLFSELGDRQGLAMALEGMAAALGPTARAARLYGAAEALRGALGAPLPTVECPDYEQHVAAIRRELGVDAANRAWREGQSRPLDQLLGERLNGG